MSNRSLFACEVVVAHGNAPINNWVFCRKLTEENHLAVERDRTALEEVVA